MSEIVEGLGEDERQRIAELRAEGHFFWIDLCAEDAASGGARGAARRPAASRGARCSTSSAASAPSRRFTASRRQVVFPFQCYIEEDGRG